MSSETRIHNFGRSKNITRLTVWPLLNAFCLAGGYLSAFLLQHRTASEPQEFTAGSFELKRTEKGWVEDLKWLSCDMNCFKHKVWYWGRWGRSTGSRSCKGWVVSCWKEMVENGDYRLKIPHLGTAENVHNKHINIYARNSPPAAMDRTGSLSGWSQGKSGAESGLQLQSRPLPGSPSLRSRSPAPGTTGTQALSHHRTRGGFSGLISLKKHKRVHVNTGKRWGYGERRRKDFTLQRCTLNSMGIYFPEESWGANNSKRVLSDQAAFQTSCICSLCCACGMKGGNKCFKMLILMIKMFKKHLRNDLNITLEKERDINMHFRYLLQVLLY